MPGISTGSMGLSPKAAGTTAAKRPGDPLALCDREDPVDGGKPDGLPGSRRPANLDRPRIGGIAKAEMRALVVGRDVAAAAHYVLALPDAVGSQVNGRAHAIARAPSAIGV